MTFSSYETVTVHANRAQRGEKRERRQTEIEEKS